MNGYLHTYTKQRLFDHMTTKLGYYAPGNSRQCVFTKDFLLEVIQGKCWLPMKDEVLTYRAFKGPTNEHIFSEI